jgi:hypothetical protein
MATNGTGTTEPSTTKIRNSEPLTTSVQPRRVIRRASPAGSGAGSGALFAGAVSSEDLVTTDSVR